MSAAALEGWRPATTTGDVAILPGAKRPGRPDARSDPSTAVADPRRCGRPAAWRAGSSLAWIAARIFGVVVACL
jgi:hypothetical protein